MYNCNFARKATTALSTAVEPIVEHFCLQPSIASSSLTTTTIPKISESTCPPPIECNCPETTEIRCTTPTDQSYTQIPTNATGRARIGLIFMVFVLKA